MAKRSTSNDNDDDDDDDVVSLSNIIKIVISALLLAFLITRIILPTKVVGYSMYPTLIEGDYVLVNRLDKVPNNGETIVFYYGHFGLKYLVKRVIAVEGDMLELSNGVITVNGVKLDEPYINEDWESGVYSGTIPKGQIFVMGDNRNYSTDSRIFGLVSEDKIIGKVVLRFFPLCKLGLIM